MKMAELMQNRVLLPLPRVRVQYCSRNSYCSSGRGESTARAQHAAGARCAREAFAKHGYILTRPPMDNAATQAENAQERRLASLQRQQQEQQSLSSPHSIVGSAVKFGAVTVHSAALLAEICGESELEPEPELEPPPVRGSSGGSVSVNVDTLVCTLLL